MFESAGRPGTRILSCFTVLLNVLAVSNGHETLASYTAKK